MTPPARPHKPVRRNTLEDTLAKILDRLWALEHKPSPSSSDGSATGGDLNALKDVEVLYAHPTKKPKNHSVLSWTTGPGPYGGKAKFRGGPDQHGDETSTIEGEGGFGFALADGTWDEHFGCGGGVSVELTPSYGAGPYDDDAFSALLSVQPWDASAGPPPSSPLFDEHDLFSASSVYGVGAFATGNLAVPATLRAGKPYAFVYVKQPSDCSVSCRLKWNIYQRP